MGKFWLQSLLGGSLLGQKRFAEAELPLLAGYEGVKQREAKIPAGFRPLLLRESLQRVAEFYQATDQPEKVLEWGGKLEDFDKTEAQKNP